MSGTAPLQTAAGRPLQTAGANLVLQRKCACGAGASSLTGECAECSTKKLVGLQTKLRISEPGDVYEQEADRVAEQVLAKPAHPNVSIAPPRIQRFSGPSSGQKGAAPASVDHVLASPGRPLEPALRHDMEQRFGHDFSRVRVYSGAAAEQSARAVNAHAYTVGRSIVFGPGEYAPLTEKGRRLLAHELTHVAQQGSQHNSPTLRRDARVPLPGWGDELIGDDDSDVVFQPLAVLEPEPGAKPARYWYQRFSGLPAADGYRGKVMIRAGTKGVVTLKVKAHFELDQLWNDEIDQQFQCSWDVVADKYGKLTISDASRQINPPSDNEAEFSLQSLEARQNAEAGYVQMEPVFVSYQSTDVPNISVGGQVGNDKRSVGGQVTLGNERTYPPGSLVRSFRVDIVVVGIAPPPEPQVLIESVSMRRHATHKVYFRSPGEFKVRRRDENDLVVWYTSLNEETRRLIREEGENLKLDGFASSTDEGPNNRVLAEKRVHAVEAILRGQGAKEFDSAWPGEYEPGVGEPSDEIEDKERRKVVIKVLEAPVTVTPLPDAP